MRDLYQVLEQKELEIEHVRRQIEALHLVIPLLAEDADRIEHRPVSLLSVSQFRGTATVGVKGWARGETRAGALMSPPLVQPDTSQVKRPA